MTRTRWTGLAGVLFGVAFFGAGALAGSTPNNGGADAVTRFREYWVDDDNADKARLAALLMSYVGLLLVAFAAGLRDRFRAADTGPLPSFVLAAGAVAAALIVSGAMVSVVVGATAADSKAFEVDGHTALLLDHLGYGLMAPGLMAAAAMAVAVGLLSLRTRALPGWTAYLGFLLGLGAIGSYYSAWTGFFALPVWSVVVGILLMLQPADAREADGRTPNG